MIFYISMKDVEKVLEITNSLIESVHTTQKKLSNKKTYEKLQASQKKGDKSIIVFNEDCQHEK